MNRNEMRVEVRNKVVRLVGWASADPEGILHLIEEHVEEEDTEDGVYIVRCVPGIDVGSEPLEEGEIDVGSDPPEPDIELEWVGEVG